MIFNKNKKLKTALKNSDTKTVKACIKAGAVFDESWIASFLYNSICRHNIDVIKTYVESGLNIERIVTDATEKTMLYSAVDARCYEIIKYLIGHDAETNTYTASGTSPLYNIAHTGSDDQKTADIIKILVKNGAHINYQGNAIGKTALMGAASSGDGNEIATRTLIELGADLTLTNDEADTAWGYSGYKIRHLFPEHQVMLKKEAQNKRDNEEEQSNGKWSICFGKSIACIQISKEIKTELKQIFNFSAREVTKIIRNTETNFESHSTQLFAEYPDKELLKTACIQYNKQHSKEHNIYNPPLDVDEMINISTKIIDGKITNKTRLRIEK